LAGDKKIERKGVMNRVKEFRKEKKMSQLELAKSIGVSRQTINMIENNKYNPTLELCINLAKTLDTDLNALFWDPQLTDEDSED
jgi:transcription regulator